MNEWYDVIHGTETNQIWGHTYVKINLIIHLNLRGKCKYERRFLRPMKSIILGKVVNELSWSNEDEILKGLQLKEFCRLI